LVERGHVVADQRLLIACEDGGDLGQHLGAIDLHHCAGHHSLDTGALATPCASSARAARSARSSRHGAAINCTPIGSVPPGHSGAATTGQPAKAIGCVSQPIEGRAGSVVPLTSISSVP